MKTRRQFAGLLAGACLLLASAAPIAAGQDKKDHKSDRNRPVREYNDNTEQKPHPYAGAWLKRYENTPPQQSEEQLRKEHDFQQLPPDRQQQLLNRLHDFANQPPDQRARTIQRLQALEQMTPQERQQLHEADQQRKALPEDRRREVNRAYNFLRELPSGEREQMLDSPTFSQRFNDQERGILRGLLKAPQVEAPLAAPPRNPQP